MPRHAAARSWVPPRRLRNVRFSQWFARFPRGTAPREEGRPGPRSGPAGAALGGEKAGRRINRFIRLPRFCRPFLCFLAGSVGAALPLRPPSGHAFSSVSPPGSACGSPPLSGRERLPHWSVAHVAIQLITMYFLYLHGILTGSLFTIHMSHDFR